MIKKIISGGQTGADIAGVDAAISCGVSYGGWLPKGRKAENGPVPVMYTAFQVMTRGGYPKRKEQNIMESDGTVIFSRGTLRGGSALTRRLCKKHGRPFLYIDLDIEVGPSGRLEGWVVENSIQVLNVAGSRESKHPGIHREVMGIVRSVLLSWDEFKPGGGDMIREIVLPYFSLPLKEFGIGTKAFFWGKGIIQTGQRS